MSCYQRHDNVSTDFWTHGDGIDDVGSIHAELSSGCFDIRKDLSVMWQDHFPRDR